MEGSLPAWWNKGREQRNARSRKQEREHAKATGGRVQSGSGSSWRAPHDVVNEEYLDELKFTDQKGFTVRQDYWEALKASALRAGREPRIIIEFPGGTVLAVTEHSGD